MTARVAGFVSRAQAGLRRPTSVSRNITPSNGGVAGHWGGTAQRVNTHADCLKIWRGWQSYHMRVHGWSDIAYTMGYCQHGYAFAGRGAGVRTAANGTNAGNQSYYAVTWIGGQGQAPTRAALDAFEWCVLTLRKAGAGRRVRPHNAFKDTACPGPQVKAHCQALDGREVSPVPAPPRPSPKPPAPGVPAYPGLTVEGMQNSPVTRAYQARLKARGWNIVVDGDHGPGTTRVLKQFQQEKRLGVDGKGGPATWRALWTAPR